MWRAAPARGARSPARVGVAEEGVGARGGGAGRWGGSRRAPGERF